MVPYPRSSIQSPDTEILDDYPINDNSDAGAGKLVFNPRPPGCIFSCRYTPCPLTFSQICCGCGTPPIQGPALWPFDCPTWLLKSISSHNSTSQEKQGPHFSLPRQLSPQVPHPLHPSDFYNCLLLPQPGSANKQKKIYLTIYPTNRLNRGPSRFYHRSCLTSTGRIPHNGHPHCLDMCQPPGYGLRFPEAVGTHGLHTCGPKCPLVHALPSGMASHSIETKHVQIKQIANYDSKSQGLAPMVNLSCQPL